MNIYIILTKYTVNSYLINNELGAEGILEGIL